MTRTILDRPSDPIEGGSANDYDYADADPNNNFDLNGEFCTTGVARTQRWTTRDANGKVHRHSKQICRSMTRGFGSIPAKRICARVPRRRGRRIGDRDRGSGRDSGPCRGSGFSGCVAGVGTEAIKRINRVIGHTLETVQNAHDAAELLTKLLERYGPEGP